MIIVYILCFLILMGAWAWIQDTKMLKKSQIPLKKEIKENYFFKEIIEITNKIKSIQSGDDVKIFVQNSKKSIFLLENEKVCFPYEAVQITFGLVGVMLSSGFRAKDNKIDGIIRIQNTWEFYLSKQLDNSIYSKEEIKQIKKDITKSLIFLLNSKVLLKTRQKEVKKAWEIILKNKVITSDALNLLWGHVVKELFQNIGNFKKSLKQK